MRACKTWDDRARKSQWQQLWFQPQGPTWTPCSTVGLLVLFYVAEVSKGFLPSLPTAPYVGTCPWRELALILAGHPVSLTGVKSCFYVAPSSSCRCLSHRISLQRFSARWWTDELVLTFQVPAQMSSWIFYSLPGPSSRVITLLFRSPR